MELREFLETVITTEEGYFCLAYADSADNEEDTRKSWKEEFFEYPKRLDDIISRVADLGDDRNIYFSPYLFSKSSSIKHNALPSRTIVADLDDANILTLHLKPTILVESSTARHQGYWILKEELPLDQHESLSKNLTYSIPRCDRTGWYRGKKVRVPGTMNHKYVTGPQYVRIIDNTGIKYTQTDLETLPTLKEMYGSDAEKFEIDEENLEWVVEAEKIDIGPQELLHSIKSSLPQRIIAQYNIPAPDRSTALWALMTNAFRGALSKEKVYYLAKHCANNKFKDLKYGGIKELAKDVLRAEMAVKIKLPDVKSRILEARRLEGKPYEISRYLADIVIEQLKKIGSFIHTIDDNTWFIREDTGRPIQISMRSEQLEVLIDTFFGINASEKEYNYICRSIISFIKEMPPLGQVATLSHFDVDSNTFLMHTGGKDVLQVTKNGITRVINGYNGIIFPWNIGNTSISPNYQSKDKSWDVELFEGCFDNVITIKSEQARAIIKVWFMSVLLRDALVSRPILACFGQPGAGKSTLFRRIYSLLYGKGRSLNTITKEDDFDYATIVDPLVVMDNVDTAHRWLPDKLAISAAPSEWTKRKLFTDNDTITLKRQAMIAITAHAPKFGREDVTDRLLLINFERLQHFQPETQIIERIIKLRNAFWGDILKDIQKILNTPVPRSGWPQFRVEDFARFGFWIATALGEEHNFCDGINIIRQEQKKFSLEEDSILVETLEKLVQLDTKAIVDGKKKDYPTRTPSQLLGILGPMCADIKSFEGKYKNAITLGRKLWTLQDSLRAMFDIRWEYNSATGSRVWKIEPLTTQEIRN